MDDLEQQGMCQLVALLADTDQWVARISEEAEVSPLAGSPLAGDDKAAGKFPVSGSAWTHLTVAVDHLSTLRAATVGCGRHETLTVHLHLAGQFTLMRSMIENASAVLWLLSSPQRTDRVLRRLQLAAGDIRNNEAVRDLIKSPGVKTKDQRLNEVRAVATGLNLDPRAASRGPGYEDIVRTAGEASAVGGDLAVVMWRACSGLAHGDFWATVVLPGKEHLASAVPGMANLRLSPNVDGLCTVLLAAKVLISEAFQMYERYRQPPSLTLPA